MATGFGEDSLENYSSHSPVPLVRVQGFHKRYRDTVAVENLSFEVSSGQIVGLVGANGAGKTTTLRCLAGIIPPSRGQLLLDGFDVVNQGVDAKRHVAYVPDDPRLFESLTIWEHLEFMASAYEVADFAQRGVALLEQFQLLEKRDALAQELSRGMRQKVAIVCAYLHQPQVVLLDEPLTGLDPRGIRIMKDSIRERAGQGIAFMVSSHLLDLVEDLCTHLLVMHRGRSLFCGAVSEARQIAASAAGSTLEDIFFHITEGGTIGPKIIEPKVIEPDIVEAEILDADPSN